MAKHVPYKIVAGIVRVPLPMVHGNDGVGGEEGFDRTYPLVIIVQGKAFHGRHRLFRLVFHIVRDDGKAFVGIRNAGFQVFQRLQQSCWVFDNDLSVIEVLVERSQRGGFRRAEEAIGHGHRGDTRDRPGNVVVKEAQRVGGTCKGAEVEHEFRLPFEDKFS